ncbi:tetratricopeptide repeat protein [Gluconacetobacter sp. 1b LMG 1731]|uniref:Tetratricopeptide repeat protein n=1 Tax=Gluconacetobacter dulcium TaxID=2729096 RepID=A0A7W4IPB4_9PROT|nr:tetratricopeptide repeat protein [Gluconacetobacter dulcium]MBB2166581.1 tetratricopeptide repeat protein [Gluconacetobacter dulcium]MBB2195671.1 tetratricopeptide repeat protein [Gluconacetobacter dulcium]
MDGRQDKVAGAMKLLADGDREGATVLLRAALADAPDDPDGLHGMACVARASGRPDLAIGLAGRAIAILPAAHFHITLGCALQEQGHLEPARAALHVATLREPRDPRAHAALAAVLGESGRWGEAEASLRAALDLRPADTALLLDWGRAAVLAGGTDVVPRLAAGRFVAEDAGRLHELAGLLSERGRNAQAERLYRLVRDLCPERGAAWANHGAVLFALNRHEDALAALEQADRLAPDVAETLNNLGLVLMALGHLPRAGEVLARARRAAPDDVRIAINDATILADLGEDGEADRLLRGVLADPVAAGGMEGVRAVFNRGTLLLARGDLAEGWRSFEARTLLLPETRWPDIGPWDGSALPHGRLLLHAEQGIGDAIQFLRYLPLCLRRVRVVLVLPPSLHRLARTMPDPDGLIASPCLLLPPGASVPDDVVARCGLLSLPYLLDVAEVPPFAPYLLPSGVEGAAFRVGVCWAGNPAFRFDRRRSIAPAMLAPLGDVAGLRFVSLQHGAVAEDRPFAMETVGMGDWLETAQVIAGLDLVVTVDTAIAHLAGAMGRPVWLLNRFGGDWRWSEAFDRAEPPRWGNGTSRWYPSLEQFRQTEPEEPDDAWRAPIRMLCGALARWRRGDL